MFKLFTDRFASISRRASLLLLLTAPLLGWGHGSETFARLNSGWSYTNGFYLNDAASTILTAPPDFDVSTASATTGLTSSSGNLAIAPINRAVNQPVYVRPSGSATAETQMGGITNLNGIANPLAPTISTGAISPVTVVAGNNVTVAYSTTETFNAGNAFTAVLSDASGSFSSGTTALTTTSAGSGSLTVTIPATTPAGTGYRIRINASNPATTGSNSTNALTVTPSPLLAYNFTGNNTIPSTRDANVAETPFARSAAVTFNMGDGRFNSKDWATATSVDLSKYVSFTFNPNSGYQATLTSLSFANQRSGTGPTTFEVRSSVDDYATAFLTGTVVGTAKNLPVTGMLTSTGYTNIQATTGVTFRIYAYGATSTIGTYSVDDVQLYGTVTAAPALAPEPTEQPTVTATSIASNTVLLTVTGGNGGAKRLVVLRPTSAPAVAPTDRRTYSANSTYGNTGINSTTGTDNFVVVADGSTGALTVTGLQSNTAYTAEAYAYNDGATPGIENYLTTSPGTATFTTLPPPVVTYVWTGLLGTSYSNALNWSPPRALPAANDVLVFDRSLGTPATPVVVLDYAGSEAIRQLFVRNGVQVTFSTDADRTLILNNDAAGDDFVVDATSALTLTNSNPLASSGLTLSLASLKTAVISGTLVFDGNTTAAGQHSLVSAAPANSNAIEFRSGARFQATARFNAAAGNSVFGSTNGSSGSPFSVVFRNGATYEQGGGTNPFGLTAPSSFVTFEPQSRYLFNSAGRPALSGRTYGTLEYNATPAFAGDGVSPLVVLGDLVVTQGAVELNLTGGINVAGNVQVSGSGSLAYRPGAPSSTNTGYTIQGDILVNNSASFTFSPSDANAPPLQLNGAQAQTIGGSAAGSGAVTFGDNGSLQINNPAGVTLLRPLTVRRGLVLTSGLLSTTATNLLTLSNTPSGYATFSGGSSTSFVNGPIARTTVSGAAAALVFPIGKGTAYRPLTLNVASSNTVTATYVAEQVETPPVRTLTTSDPIGVDLLRISSAAFSVCNP
jgi:hypothetical protein